VSDPRRNAIVIVVDGWQSGMAGCYGNTWIRTPALDRLAAEAVVCDGATIASADLAAFYRDLGAASGFGPNNLPRGPVAKLWGTLRDQKIHPALITDDPTVDEHFAGAAELAPADRLLLPAETGRAARDVATTQFARVLAAASAWLAEAQAPFCLWIHSRGFTAAWDAPYEFRQQYADEEDPAPPDFVRPPNLVLADSYDPDELLGIQQAYAGQVSALDDCLGALLEHFRESSLAASTLLIVTAARGYPLGEHRIVGLERAAPYSELIQVPLLIRAPAWTAEAARSAALVQPADLGATLLEWFAPQIDPPIGAFSLGALLRGEEVAKASRPCGGRDRAATHLTSNCYSLRTARWHLTAAQDTPPTDWRYGLFVKPDDRFEVNELSRRCPEVVEALIQAARDLQQANAAGKSAAGDEFPLPPLAEAATAEIE
jgi:arylsulfatase A-like enzyme